jgi:hypothetical protein
MGCFDVVCALTNTPILSGEKCHLVILRKDVSWDGIEWLVLGGGSKWDIETIYHGEYNDYGSIENVEGKLTKEDEYLIETFRDHMHEPNNERKHFFICDMAYKSVMEEYKDVISHWVKERIAMRELRALSGKASAIEVEFDEAKDQRENEIYRLMIAFRRACKSPMSGLGLYHQFDRDDLKGIRRNLELTLKRVEELEAHYGEWDEEDAQDAPEDEQDVTLG